MWTSDPSSIQIQQKAAPEFAPEDLLTLQQVMAVTQVSKGTIYREIRLGRFPLPIKVAGDSARWLRRELVDYLMARVVERYAQQAQDNAHKH